MPWTQASDVTNDNDWAGRCNALDIFDVIDPIPPTDFDDDLEEGVITDDDDILILEGFELDDDYVDGTQEDLFTALFNPGTFSISSVNRGTTITAGQSLKGLYTTLLGGQIRWPVKITGQTYEYFRAYLKFDVLQNTEGNLRTVQLFGWVDSTGFRSVAMLTFNADGSIKWSVDQTVLGNPAVLSSIGPTTGVWYRCELVTETLAASGGMTTKLFVYEDDTDTLLTTVTQTAAGVAMGGFPFIGWGTANTGNAMTVYFDDVRIQTGTPVEPIAAVGGPKWGAGGIWPMRPLADSVAEWTPLSGDNFENVNEFPLSNDAATSYVETTGAVQLRDLYTVEYPQGTIPSGKYIKTVQVRAFCARPSGGVGNPTLSTLYQSPNGTILQGATRVIEDTDYRAYPDVSSSGNSRMPHIFLVYEPGMPSGFKNSHKIGIQRETASAIPASRVTMVWGYVEVSDNV